MWSFHANALTSKVSHTVNSPLSRCLYPYIEENVSPHCDKHSHTNSPPLPSLKMTYMWHVSVMPHQYNQFPVISFSQLVQRFRETVSSFDYSQCYQDKDGQFSNKDSGPACLLSQSVVFPKVSKQYSKCFTAANQNLRLSKLLLGSVKQDMLPFWRRPTSEDTDNEVMPT